MSRTSATHQGCYYNAQDAELSHEARRILRTTRIDLDAFLALDGEQRAARWRQWDALAKQDAVVQMLTRKYGDWTEAEIEQWIARYDEKWGAEPLTIEAAVSGALERLAEENATHARTSRAAGEKDDARFFQRCANGYVRALEEWQAGIRPQQTANGNWLLPSRTGGQPHLLTKDCDWRCTCPAGATIHWASALLIGIEVAHEELDRHGDPVPELPPGDTAATFDVITIERHTVGASTMDQPGQPLGVRLAAARRVLVEAV